MKNNVNPRTIILIIYILVVIPHNLSAAKVIVTLDEIINVHIYNNLSLKAAKKRYENSILEYENYRKSLLPAVSFSLSPVSFNRSYRLLQDAIKGDYYNVNDYSLTSNGAMTITQKIGLAGGVLSATTSMSFLREISKSMNSYNTIPFYITYNQTLFGTKKTYTFEREQARAKLSLAQMDFIQTVCATQTTAMELYLSACTLLEDYLLCKEVVDADSQLVSISHKLLGKGKITAFDYNKVQIQAMEDKMSLDKTILAYESTLNQLKDYIGTDIELQPITPEAKELPRHISLAAAQDQPAAPTMAMSVRRRADLLMPTSTAPILLTCSSC